MPDKQLQVATYAAATSLAAIALVYVFAPTFFIDGESASSSASSRKKTIVGLTNPANDCFINSVLQALAGLGDLRIYLIRETHRRRLDGDNVYETVVSDPARPGMPPWKTKGLQAGLVTGGLKDILDALNERPIWKKTISAGEFVKCLENAFRQRISRQQQDAQEFLQVVAERLCDEYHAGHRARDFSRSVQNGEIINSSPEEPVNGELEQSIVNKSPALQSAPIISEPEILSVHQSGGAAESLVESMGERRAGEDNEDGFPLEGGSESQIECLTCGFKPQPTTTTFCSLTLSVPQVSSTTLSSCFDQMFKTEYIEDFKCEKCRLVHALETYQQEYARSTSEKFKEKIKTYIDKLQLAIDTNPEEELEGVELPDTRFAPKRKIAKHVRITHFPKIMAIHLSRSIFDAGRSTMKNSAKVAFPERLPLGGLLNQRFYRLSSVVCHKGSHHSGHYESFRRQAVIAPFSTPNAFMPVGVYSKPTTPISSEISTPQIGATHKHDVETSTLSSTPELLSPSSAASSSPSLPYTNGNTPPGDSHISNGRSHSTSTASTSSTTTAKNVGPTSAPRDSDTSSIRSMAKSARSTISTKLSRSKGSSTSSPTSTPEKRETNGSGKETVRTSMGDVVRGKRKKRSDRWWRISDDKIKEGKTSDVLGMQKEVYLLFYELERDGL